LGQVGKVGQHVVKFAAGVVVALGLQIEPDDPEPLIGVGAGRSAESITRRRTSRGIDDVAIRMSRRKGCSVASASTRVQRGVISVMPWTMSVRPAAVASERMRRPNSSKGLVSRIDPTAVTGGRHRAAAG